MTVCGARCWVRIENVHLQVFFVGENSSNTGAMSSKLMLRFSNHLVLAVLLVFTFHAVL